MDQALQIAQLRTEQYLACLATGGAAEACAREVDPEYGGWGP